MSDGLNLFSHGLVDLWVSPEVMLEDRVEEDADEVGFTSDIAVETALEYFLDPKEKRTELVQVYQELIGDEDIAILFAHGSSQRGRWVYESSGKKWPVDDWIARHDGKYGVLILYCCNPGHHRVESIRSAVLAPDRTYSHFDLSESNVRVEVFIPGLEYVSEYTIEHDIEELRRRLQAKGKEVARK